MLPGRLSGNMVSPTICCLCLHVLNLHLANLLAVKVVVINAFVHKKEHIGSELGSCGDRHLSVSSGALTEGTRGF